MKHKNKLTSIPILLGALLIAGGMIKLLTGCATIDATQISDRSGAELWSQACMRCHNFRDVASLSDREWDIAAHHMRVRGNLTAVEHEKILVFLKATN